MVEPVAFGFNEETAANNYFQQRTVAAGETVQACALKEFRGMVDKLRANGIEVIVVQDTPIPHTPDSIFPNNWVSFHDDGTVVLYPMFAENRRAERRADILQRIESEGFSIRRKVDYTGFEEENRFLEGTGGIILDRVTVMHTRLCRNGWTKHYWVGSARNRTLFQCPFAPIRL